MIFSPQLFSGNFPSKPIESNFASIELMRRIEANDLTQEIFEELVTKGATIDNIPFLESFKKAAWRGFDPVIAIILEYYSKNFFHMSLEFLDTIIKNLHDLIEKHPEHRELVIARQNVLLRIQEHARYTRNTIVAQQLSLSSIRCR